MEEIWKDIQGYEGMYQVSNYGRVKSLGRLVNGSNQYGVKFQYLKKDKILKPILDKWGYLRISIYKNNHKIAKRIHILVAETFLENQNNYSIINHINGDKTDNRVENLEWCTQSHNVQESYRLGLRIPTGRAVNQYDLDGNFIKTWDTIKEPRLLYNNSHISDCCNGTRKTAAGYIWRYAKK